VEIIKILFSSRILQKYLEICWFLMISDTGIIAVDLLHISAYFLQSN
jgi:hypothetical protein